VSEEERWYLLERLDGCVKLEEVKERAKRSGERRKKKKEKGRQGEEEGTDTCKLDVVKEKLEEMFEARKRAGSEDREARLRLGWEMR
jgi:hypothetical protein